MLRTLLALVLAFLPFVYAVPAHAILITESFTVGGNPRDPVNAGVIATGYFTYDSSLIPVGGGALGHHSSEVQLASSISFDWDGTHWDTSNARLVELVFDTDGNLIEYFLGGLPQVNGLGSSGGDDFYFHYGDLTGIGDYVRAESPTTSYRFYIEGPEPGMLALFGVGLVALGLIRRK